LTHEALFYSDVEEFLLGTLAFVRDGLAAGQPVLVAVPEPRLGLLRAELAEAAAPGGAVRLVDMVEVGRNPNRILPWVLSAFVHEHLPGSVRVVGEPLYLGRTPEEIPPCVQHEALINVAFAGVPAKIMCPYDAVRLPQVLPNGLAYAEWTHPVLAGRAGRRPSTNYRPPQSVVAHLNQPLPEPRRVGASMDFDAHGLAGVRAQVAKIAEGAGLEPARVADLRLAVTEIGTNAVTHAGVPTATLRLWSDGDRLVCEIRGAGEILDPMAGRVIPKPDSPRGRGLLLANQLCDLVQTHTGPGGTVTRLHMLVSHS
jgi:anti-sigma regulatory factor (Ser/Thr protein kinase)